MENNEKSSRKTGKVLLWSVAAIAVIAAAGVVGGKVMLEKTVKASLEDSGASAGSLDVGYNGRVTLTDVTLPLENDGTMHIAALEARPEFLFFSGMIDAKDIVLDADETHIVVPSLKVEEAGLNRAFLAAVTAENGLTMAERAERMSAGRIEISQAVVTQSLEGVEQTATYSDVVLNDIVAGHVGSYSASGVEAQSDLLVGEDENGDPQPVVTKASFGEITGQDIDIPFIVKVYTEARPNDGESPARQVYGPVSAKNFVMETEKARVTYKELSSDGFSMRMADKPVLDVVKALQEAAAGNLVTEEDEQRMALDAIALIDVFAKADIHVSGIDVTTDAEPDGIFTIDALSLSLADLHLGLSLDGLDFRSGKDTITLDNVSWTDLSLEPTVNALRSIVEAGPDGQEAFSPTAVLPDFGTFKMTGYSVHLNELKDGDDGFEADEPINFTIDESTLVMRAPFNGIPTDVRMTIDGFKVELSEGNDNKAFDLLKDLGYKEVTFSQNIQAHWDKASNTLIIDDISYGGDEMGSVSLSGTIGNFGEEFFSGNKFAMQAALFGLTAHEVKLRVENDGLFARGVKLYADENGVGEEQAKLMLAMMPSILASGFNTDDPGVQAVLDAISAFIVNPNTLEVAIAAKSEEGIGAPALMTATIDPESLLEQVNITATAE